MRRAPTLQFFDRPNTVGLVQGHLLGNRTRVLGSRDYHTPVEQIGMLASHARPPLSFRRIRTGSEGPRSAMKFVLAAYGTRGDVEPSVVVGRELLRRGHDVCIAVPPDHIGFAEAAGLAAVAYGPDSQAVLDKELGTNLFKDFPRHVKDLARLWRENLGLLTQG